MPHKNDSLIIKSASLIGIATFISRVLGLVREQILLALFSRFQTDAFNVAFRIPNLLRDLFAEGALSAAFVPTFTKTLQNKGSSAAWRLGSLVFNFLLLIIGSIVVVGILNAHAIVQVIAGDFSSSTGKFSLTVNLTQIMFPFLLLVALASVAMGILNSHKQFFVPALAPALFNIGSILITLLMFYVLPKFGIDPVIGLAIGVLTGGLMQLLIQFPSLLKLGFKYSPSLSIKNSALQKILLLMGPGTLGLAATQINLFISTWLATTQGEGPVTWLNAAFRLMYLPIGIFGVAVALGAQDLFKNLISGILVLVEKRFKMGDWILVEGIIEGIVEKIGFRSTTIRKFDKSLAIIPNFQFAENAVINISQTTNWIISWTINLQYDSTVEQLKTIRNEIEDYIKQNEDYKPELGYAVRIDKFADSSIDMYIRCFTKTDDWDEWLAVKERLAISIKQIVEKNKASFAFPSQSIYVEKK